jgi:hypothetical protein
MKVTCHGLFPIPRSVLGNQNRNDVDLKILEQDGVSPGSSSALQQALLSIKEVRGYYQRFSSFGASAV